MATVTELSESVIAELKKMTPDERGSFFGDLQMHYCTNCGDAGQAINCVCMNDE